MKIFVYSFSNTAFFFNEVFKESKRANENIEWGVIYPTFNYKNSSDGIVKKENIFYLYENFDKIFNDKSHKNILYNFPNNCSNIHKIIIASKHGYKKYNAFRQEHNANVTYELYKTYLLKNRPDYMVFPDLEVVDGLILLNVCKELKIGILYTVHTRMFGKSFFAQDNYETLPEYYSNYNSFDIDRSKQFLKLFKEKKIKLIKKRAYNINEGSELKEMRIPNIFFRYFNGLLHRFKYEKKMIIEATFVTKILIILPRMHELYLSLKFKLFQKKYIKLNTDSLEDLPEKFIFFPLQKTPESSINTLEQYFLDQGRLIDLVRLNMPDNFYLVVKEHPIMVGYRKTSFYKKICNTTGVIMAHQDLDTKLLMDKSKLVVTITGTIGLEAYLNKKNILIFGPTFFSHLCTRFDSYLNLKNTLYHLTLYKEEKKEQEEHKVLEIAKLYNISYDFILFDPIFFPDTMRTSNIENFISAVKKHIERIEDN